MGAPTVKVLVVAARQPDFAELLEKDGFEVELRTRPLVKAAETDADVAVVFRGRLIGRAQAPTLVKRGNRVAKADLAQVVHAVAAWSRRRVEA
jgi:hypothetical protein